jgi:prepilin-type processing-associated H-X9-DG protein
VGLTAVMYANNSKTCGSGANTSYVGNSLLNSNHTGGINVLLVDGSVRFVTDSFNFATFQRLCTRNDGLVASFN